MINNPMHLPESFLKRHPGEALCTRPPEKALVQLMKDEGYVTRLSATVTLGVVTSAAAKWIREVAAKVDWYRATIRTRGRKGASAVWVRKEEDLPNYLQAQKCEVSSPIS